MDRHGPEKVVLSRSLTLILAASVLALLSTPAGGQERPDFSGTWTSAGQGRGPSSAGRGQQATGTLGSGWGSTFSIEQDADTLTVTRVFFARSDFQPPIKYRFALDGSETRNVVLMGRGMQEQVSTTKWEGESLVITTSYDVPLHRGGERIVCEMTHTLSLPPPRAGTAAWPPALVVETVRGGVLGGPPSTTRTVYNRN
jgi:hypothetical protein